MAPVLRVAGHASGEAARRMRQACSLATDAHTLEDEADEVVGELRAQHCPAELESRTPPPFPPTEDAWLSWRWTGDGWQVIRWDGRHWEAV